MNKQQNLLIFFVFVFSIGLIPSSLFAQFPPPAGQEGSTAIPADSEDLIGWGTALTVIRGWKDIAQPDSGYVDSGQIDFGIGAPDNMTLSLGDGGAAVITFEHPIRNGEGWDFAVFENGFDDTFLELAFVEVSSNGQDFYRFPATSLTDTTAEIGTFGLLEATKLNNLAGKYRVGQGVPFDLAELANVPDLDIERISHVKLIDVVGTMDENYASRDAQGNKINDPYPTPFAQGGFDLDAVGVRYQTIIDEVTMIDVGKKIKLYPNPVQAGATINIGGLEETMQQNISMALYQSNGFFIKKIETEIIETADLKRGLYFLKISNNVEASIFKIIMK